METAKSNSRVAQFLRESFWWFVICAIISSAWNVWPRPVPAGLAFSLESTIVGTLLNALLLFLIIEIPLAFFRFAGENLDARPAIRKAYIIAMCLPLLFGGLFFEFGRFDTVFIDDERAALRGPSSFAENDFRIQDIDLVYLKRNRVFTEIVFMWYDKAIQSTWIFAFDASSTKELQQLIDVLAEHGVIVHDREPEDKHGLGLFRPLK